MANGLYDCWMIQGQLDLNSFLASKYLRNEKYKEIKVLHNVTAEEAKAWCSSPNTWKIISEIETKDPSLYVSHFWTTAQD